ncbi:abortive infection family protein [Modestobacter excelsi]|uniref:abortive infection family protein n=1 Tax=Modestobacter excelsi TaxID=2213161 RepID=UPI00110CC6AC|nr:abortive infection family protein [Modestobacter excelsi]
MATFSKRTLRILGDVLTDWSTLTPIGHLFEDNSISPPPPEVAEEAVQGINGQRRGLTAQYVASLDLSDPADRRKLLRVFDDVLADVLPREGDENGDRARGKLLRALTDDGFALGPEGQLRAVAGRRVEIPLDQIADIEVLEEHLVRIDREVDTDPAGALSAVKALIESTAKIVLRETGGTWERNVKFPTLVSGAQKALGLMVGTLAPDKAGDTSLKMVLDGLYKVAIGIDELRNRYGRDHGRDTPLRGLTERHARLAVHSGTAYCRFLLDTLADPAAPWRPAADPPPAGRRG